jgi:hypothetical protein
MVESTFRESLSFLGDIGIFDVVLPFLLVFTIVFAILEKTRIFGTEKVDGKDYTKKNLNSLAAFVMALFTVASAKLVDAITQITANVVILLFASVFFLLLVGSFNKQAGPEGFALPEAWQKIFIFIVFIGLFAIFLNAIEVEGKTMLRWIFDWLAQFSSDVSVAAVVLIALVAVAMWWIARPGSGEAVSAPSK